MKLGVMHFIKNHEGNLLNWKGSNVQLVESLNFVSVFVHFKAWANMERAVETP